MSPKIIGIRFGDNDFYNTIMPFLRAIADVGLEQYQFDKDKLVKLFNRSAVGFYWTCQNLLQYNEDYVEHMQLYLRIGPGQVFFDDEVNQYLQERGGWDNSEFFVLDTTQYGGKPYVYCA